MKTRIITGIVLAAILIPLLFLPNVLFFSAVGIFSIIASYEMMHMFSKKHTFRLYLYFIHIVFTVIFYSVNIYALMYGLSYEMFITFLVLLFAINFSILIFDDLMNFIISSKMITSALYLGVSFSALAFLKTQGFQVIVYLLIVAMLTDVFAYFTGVKFGKHKLAPKISPKKTIEGSIGGTFFGVLLGTVFGLVFNLFDVDGLNVYIMWLILIGITVSVSAQIGDLIASKLKRDHNIKDFSNLLPGHGGILDRFDSTLFASMLLMIFLLFLGGV